MSDKYSELVNSPIGKKVAKNLGLPLPFNLDRYQDGAPVVNGSVLFGAATDGQLTESVSKILHTIHASVYGTDNDQLSQVAGKIGLEIKAYNEGDKQAKFKALVFDASSIKTTEELKQVYEFFHPVARQVEASGRVIILGRPPEDCKDTAHAIAQRALEGFMRSVGKEFKKGTTAQLIYVAEKAEANLESTLRFFLSPRSAYVSGQVVRVGKGSAVDVDWTKPLADKTVVVTGASRGIGESIARVLARQGAYVICLDIEPQQADLQKVAGEIGGSSLVCDVTAEDAGERIKEAAAKRNGLDAIIHNAGVTRDKTLANMDEKKWDMVMDINLASQQRIDNYLLNNNGFNKNARIVSVSSIAGIAGNFGQTNYAMSKAGVIGMVDAVSQKLKNGMTINAVAPGFIETEMTAQIPVTIREAGRRMNSMSQGGLPVDVAETIAWFASPASGGVNGNVVRVCGQSLLGA